MEIQKRCYTPNFSARFVRNKSFEDVVKYAEKNNCLRTLDSALNELRTTKMHSKINLIDGYTKDGKIYSTFIVGKRSVSNNTLDVKTPTEASLEGIIELGMLGRKFKSLFGCKKAEFELKAEDIIKRYTV